MPAVSLTSLSNPPQSSSLLVRVAGRQARKLSGASRGFCDSSDHLLVSSDQWQARGCQQEAACSLHPDGGSRDLRSSHRAPGPGSQWPGANQFQFSAHLKQSWQSVWQGSGDKALLNPGTRVPFQPLGGLVMGKAGERLTLHPCAGSEFALLITDFH